MRRRTLLGGGFALAALAVGAGYARLVARPLEVLLRLVPDDAFYYLQIARHLAAGHGSTFDGLHPASGYHPGWMALLVPLAALVPAPESLLRSALGLAFLLHAGTALALAVLFRRFMGDTLAVAGALCWLLNPLALFLTVQGVESALYALSLVLVMLAMDHFVTAEAGALRPHLVLGVALGACFLARTEAGILAAVTCASAPVLRGVLPWSRAGLRSSLLVGATFTLCAAPWFLVCWWQTGSPWQSSGVAKALWAGGELAALGPWQRLLQAGELTVLDWFGWRRLTVGAIPAFRAAAWALQIPAAVGLLLAVRRPAAQARVIAWCGWLFGGCLLTGLVYGLFDTQMPAWYHAQPALVLFVVGYLWIDRARALAGRVWGLVVGTGAPLLVLALSLRADVLAYRRPPEPYPWQPSLYHSQLAFDRLLPPGASVACFNAGIAGFFGGHRVVNVDGLVNSSVIPYYRERRLDAYFRDERLGFLADDEATVGSAGRFMRRPLRLAPLASAPLAVWHAPRRWLWRVELPGEASPRRR